MMIMELWGITFHAVVVILMFLAICLYHPQHTVAEYPSVQSIKQFLDRLSAKKLIFLVYVVVGIVETFLRPLEKNYGLAEMIIQIAMKGWCLAKVG